MVVERRLLALAHAHQVFGEPRFLAERALVAVVLLGERGVDSPAASAFALNTPRRSFGTAFLIQFFFAIGPVLLAMSAALSDGIRASCA
jgi:hypothetical protein